MPQRDIKALGNSIKVIDRLAQMHADAATFMDSLNNKTRVAIFKTYQKWRSSYVREDFKMMALQATLIVVGLISDGRRQNCRKQHQLHGVRDPSRIRTRLDSIVHKPVHQTSSQILNGSIGRRRMSTNGQLYSTIQDGHTGQDQTR